MVQVIEELKAVEVGTLGDMCTPDMLRIHAYQGVNTGKFYGIVINHCKSGSDQKPRKIMFSDLKQLERIAAEMSNEQDEDRSL